MNEQALDRPVAVRSGEELDIPRLAAYLRERIPGAGGELTIRQFPGGFSNLTYGLRMGGKAWVLRRPPFGANIKSAHDMGREYRVLSRLIDAFPHVPRPLVYCEDASVVGAPFYVMERVRGVILRNRPPAGVSLTAEVMERLSASFVDLLVELHGVDAEATGLADLGRPEGYVRRQVEGWARRYANAKTDDLAEMEEAARWLAANMPPESGAAVIHNDFKYDNLVLDPRDLSKTLAVLDWEMATVGDPLMDLGVSLAYWAEPGDPEALRTFGLTSLPGNYDRRRLLARYAERSGRDIADPVFYYVYGMFKLGVIAQQIYARYKKGHTRDPRFAGLVHVVRACGVMAVRALERNRIDRLG